MTRCFLLVTPKSEAHWCFWLCCWSDPDARGASQWHIRVNQNKTSSLLKVVYFLHLLNICNEFNQLNIASLLVSSLYRPACTLTKPISSFCSHKTLEFSSTPCLILRCYYFLILHHATRKHKFRSYFPQSSTNLLVDSFLDEQYQRLHN